MGLERKISLFAQNVALSSVLLACSGDVNKNETTQNPTPTSQTTEFITGEQYPETANSLYPQLEQSGIRLRSKDSFDSGINKINVYNYTDRKFNKEVAEKIYGVINQIFSGPMTHFYETMDGKKVNVDLVKRQNYVNDVVLVPGDAKTPSDSDDPHFVIGADENKTLSVVKAGLNLKSPLFPTVEKEATLAFAIQACESLVSPVVLGSEDVRLNQNDLNNFDELRNSVCFQFTLPVAASTTGVSYEDYIALVRNGVRITGKNFIEYTKQSYESVNFGGPVISPHTSVY